MGNVDLAVAAAADSTGISEAETEFCRHKSVDNWIHTTVEVRK